MKYYPATFVRPIVDTVAIVTLCTAFCFLFLRGFENANVIMIYLAGVAFVASRYGYQESLLASFLAVAAFDFFFVAPTFTFAVSDTQYVVVFIVMLGVALLISRLTLRLRQQIQYSNDREERTAALYNLTKELSVSENLSSVLRAGVNEITNVFDADVCIFLSNPWGDLSVMAASRGGFEKLSNERAVALWVTKNGKNAGKGTDTLPGAEALYVPLVSSRGCVGTLGVQFALGMLPPIHELHHLQTFVHALSLAIERTQLADESVAARLEIETEKVRNALLSSVSHDLRTPLTVIAGTAEDISETTPDVSLLFERATTIKLEADRLNRHLTNLLDMTRLESGVSPKLECNSLEELLGAALSATKKLLVARDISIVLDPTLPLVEIDAVLVEKVFRNLLENIAKHTPANSNVLIKGYVDDRWVTIEINDSGPGIPKGREQEIFQKFNQPNGLQHAGFGLGLSICRTIMRLHGGDIFVEPQVDTQVPGACFKVQFPRYSATIR